MAWQLSPVKHRLLRCLTAVIASTKSLILLVLLSHEFYNHHLTANLHGILADGETTHLGDRKLCILPQPLRPKSQYDPLSGDACFS